MIGSNMNKKIIVTLGLPASGKSTWSKQYIKDNPDFKRINNDDLRNMMDNGKYSKENEKFLGLVRNNMISLAIQEGFNVILDNTNLNPYILKSLRAKYSSVADIEIKDFTDVSLEECIKRDSLRDDKVGADVITKMYNDYIKK